MKRPLNLTISEEARRLLTLHAERSGTSVSGLIERLIREEETRKKAEKAAMDYMNSEEHERATWRAERMYNDPPME